MEYSLDCQRSLDLDSSSEPSPSARFTLCTLTRVAAEFSHISGSKRFSPWENKPWSPNKDNLREAENGDYWPNDHNEVCSEMGGACWPLVALLFSWLQLKRCTELGTIASCSTCMLPQWHLQQQHQPCSVVPSFNTFAKVCRTRWGALIACSWWRWHIQHRNLWRSDLVTSSLFFVSWIHLAEGAKVSSVMLRSLPSMINATVPRLEKSCLLAKNLRVLFLISDQFSPQKSLHRKTHLLLRLVPKESEHNLWNQFLHGLTGHCFWLNGIPPSHRFQATALCLSANCPPLTSR